MTKPQPDEFADTEDDAATPDPVPTAEPAESVESVESAESDEREPEWWEDPRMPWAHRPTRADIACFTLISVLGIYGLALLPFRAVLITQPYLAATLTGSRTGVVTIGALTATGHQTNWPLWLILATLSVMKFDLVYFWAGKLWGRGMFDMIAGRSARARRNAERAEQIARRFSIPAILLTYLPIPLPAAVIYATLGAAGMSWRKFLLANLCFAAMMQSAYLYLGYRIGEPAVWLVAEYAKYAWYLTIAILLGMIATWWWKRRGAAAAR